MVFDGAGRSKGGQLANKGYRRYKLQAYTSAMPNSTLVANRILLYCTQCAEGALRAAFVSFIYFSTFHNTHSHTIHYMRLVSSSTQGLSFAT